MYEITGANMPWRQRKKYTITRVWQNCVNLRQKCTKKGAQNTSVLNIKLHKYKSKKRLYTYSTDDKNTHKGSKHISVVRKYRSTTLSSRKVHRYYSSITVMLRQCC